MEASISSEERVALYEKLLELIGIERKGDTIPYTSVNGHMYCYISKDGFLALRLPKQAREDFLAIYNTTLVTAYGIIQKEYVVVPDSLLQNTDELKPYFTASLGYVLGLKPKPTKRVKK
jgi:hypothetical protein